MKPSDRIRQLAKRMKDAHPQLKHAEKPPLPMYVQAIVEYLDEQAAKGVKKK